MLRRLPRGDVGRVEARPCGVISGLQHAFVICYDDHIGVSLWIGESGSAGNGER